MSPAGKFHGFVCINMGAILRDYASRQARGYVCGNDTGVVLERNPDTVRGPDICYYDDGQTPADMERGFAEHAPRLAVEVVSPNDRVNQIMQRVAELLRAGVEEVWVVDPEARDISFCRQGEQPRRLSAGDTLASEDILPGFACPVSQIFQMPGQGTS